MNKSLRGTTLALLAISPFAYLACSDDSSATAGTVTTPTVDASTTPVADAATTEVASTGPVDAGADADAAVGTTATVLALTTKKLPEQGVKVVFYDAAGTVLGTETTDATGMATHAMTAGGSVTAVFGTSFDHELVTILGVQPGDSLTALDPLGVNQTTFSVTPPAAAVPLPAGTTSLHLQFGGCSSGSFATTGGTSNVVLTDCEHGSDAPVLVLVATNANGAVVGTTASSAVPLVSNGATNVTFAGPWSTPSATDVTNVSNVSMTGTIASFYKDIRTTYSSGNGTGMLSTSASGSAINGTYTQSFSREFPGATFVQNEFDYFEKQNLPFALVTRTIATRGAPGTTTIDFSTALPAITATAVTGLPTPTVTWTSASALTATKGIVAQVYWSDSPSESNGKWLIFAPPTVTSITPPALPMDLAQSGPLTTSAYQTPTLVAAVDATFLASYATVRASAALLTPSSSLQSGSFTSVVRTLPVDGTLKLTAFGQSND